MGTNFANGLRSYGVPLPSGGIPPTKGNVFHVDSGHANTSATSTGKNPNHPVSTIDAAVALCTANNGDIILVSEGHVETVSAAAGLDLDVAGITIIGLGRGSDRPTITIDTDTAADVDIDAANVYIENLIFSANFADIAVAIDVNADDFTMRGCRFQATAVDMNFLVCVQAGTANQSDRLKVLDCDVIAIDASNTHFINFPAAEDECEVSRNRLIGDWGTMCIGGAGVITYCVVADNLIYNAASTSDGCISLPATATGICVRNLAASAAAQALGITAGDCVIAENYYGVLTEDLSGILEPIGT